MDFEAIGGAGTTEYEKIHNEFHWEVPEYYNFGFDAVDAWA